MEQQQRCNPESGVCGTAAEVGRREWSGTAEAEMRPREWSGTAAEVGPREWSEWNSPRDGTQRAE